MYADADNFAIGDSIEVPRTRCCKNWWKYSRTFVLVFSWTCLGLYSEMLGPTLQTLMYQTNSDYEQIGSALAIRSVGLLSGSILGGWTSDQFSERRALQMSSVLLLAALLNFITPWIQSLPLLSFLLYLAGVTHGVLTTNGNPLLASIWQAEASGPFSLMHAGYGLGGALASALVAPFTRADTAGNHSRDLFVPIPLNPMEANFTEPVLVDAPMPFSIVGGTLAICALSFFAFSDCFSGVKPPSRSHSSRASDPQLARKPERRSSLSTLCSPRRSWRKLLQHLRKAKNRTTRRTVLLTSGVFVIYFAIVGNERVFGKFMFSYAIFGPAQMPSENVYLLNLLYWLFFGFARVLTCFLSLMIPVRPLMFGLVIGTVLASLGLIVMPPREVWFFVMTCVFSLFKSPLFPTTLAAINRSYEITGFLVLVVNFGSAVGASLMQYAAGSLIQRFGQVVFPYIVFGTACVVLVTSSLLLLLLRKVGDRYDSNFERIDDTTAKDVNFESLTATTPNGCR